MNDIVAKKYAKAINLGDVDEFYANLKILNDALNMPKFKVFLQTNQISKIKKEEFLCSIFENASDKFKNFLKILIENSRLNLITHIIEELDKQKAINENLYFGKVLAKEPISESELKELETKLSSKFGVKIKLENKISNKDGVTIALDELGYEISFSMQNLQSKMSNYILKII